MISSLIDQFCSVLVNIPFVGSFIGSFCDSVVALLQSFGL